MGLFSSIKDAFKDVSDSLSNAYNSFKDTISRKDREDDNSYIDDDFDYIEDAFEGDKTDIDYNKFNDAFEDSNDNFLPELGEKDKNSLYDIISDKFGHIFNKKDDDIVIEDKKFSLDEDEKPTKEPRKRAGSTDWAFGEDENKEEDKDFFKRTGDIVNITPVSDKEYEIWKIKEDNLNFGVWDEYKDLFAGDNTP